MNVQIIEKDGQPEWAVIPYAHYRRLSEDAEMLADVQAYDLAKALIANGEELIPSRVTFAILEGANPLTVWRKYRGLSQKQLAELTGISSAYLSQIELGKRKGSAEIWSALAQQLQLTVDDILPTKIA